MATLLRGHQFPKIIHMTVTPQLVHLLVLNFVYSLKLSAMFFVSRFNTPPPIFFRNKEFMTFCVVLQLDRHCHSLAECPYARSTFILSPQLRTIGWYYPVATDLLLYFQYSIIDCLIQTRPALFWVITQRVVVIPYRRFGTTYRSRNVGKELPPFVT